MKNQSKDKIESRLFHAHEKNRWAWLIVGFLGCILLFLIIVYFFPLPEETTNQAGGDWLFWGPIGGALEFREAIAAGLISFIVFGLGIKIFFYSSMEKQFAEALARVIALDVSFLKSFSHVQQRYFVFHTLESLLGKGIGQSAYDYIAPMLREDAGFRLEFNYKVSISDQPTRLVADEVKGRFKVSDYRWVEERLEYKLINPTNREDKQYPRGPFNVLFLFDKPTLESLNRDQTVFARFLIELETADRDWLFGANDDEAIDRFKSVVAPVIFEKVSTSKSEMPLHQTLTIQPAIQRNGQQGQRYFKLAMGNELSASPGTSMPYLKFRHPYRRTATHFVFTHPQPVYAPEISFDYSKAPTMSDIDYSSYYSIASGECFDVESPSDTNPSRYRFTARDSWIFPVSGITMVWNNVTEGVEAV